MLIIDVESVSISRERNCGTDVCQCQQLYSRVLSTAGRGGGIRPGGGGCGYCVVGSTYRWICSCFFTDNSRSIYPRSSHRSCCRRDMCVTFHHKGDTQFRIDWIDNHNSGYPDRGTRDFWRECCRGKLFPSNSTIPNR